MKWHPIRRLLGLILLGITLFFIVWPFGKTAVSLASDRGLRSAEPSKFAYELHRSLSERLPDYTDRRIESRVAETLSVAQISATEWPLYGAFFYLTGTEQLQAQWEKDPWLAETAPRETGRAAIDACARLLVDPVHAHWVRSYWGDDHLGEPNCFYRMLLIGGLAAHKRLTGSDEHSAFLRTLTDDLAADLDRSPHGLIDDYPEQCFPADVIAAIEMVRRADPAREAWATRAYRRAMARFDGGLPPYMADARTGDPLGPPRGCTNGFFFCYARTLDPESADALYSRAVDDFWKSGTIAEGWREFARGSKWPDFHFDPDAGPVLWDFGTGATGLGVGAARMQGDHARAGALGAELIAGCIPLPGGYLLLPRLVSDSAHAPHFAELAILHQLSLTGGGAAPGLAPLPPVVWIILAVELLLSVLLLRLSIHLLRGRGWRQSRRYPRSSLRGSHGSVETDTKSPAGDTRRSA